MKSLLKNDVVVFGDVFVDASALKNLILINLKITFVIL